MIDAPRRINIEYLRGLLIKEAAKLSEEYEWQCKSDRYFAALKRMTPEERAEYDAACKKAMDDLIEGLPKTFEKAWDDNSGQWEKVFNS